MSQSALLKSSRFYPLFWTQFLGAFNDNVLKGALTMLITYQSTQVLGMNSEHMVAAANGLFTLPFFLFSATAGQLADQRDKSQLIRWVKVVEILIMVLAFVGFVFHQVGFLLAVLFLMGLHSTFFGPLKYSILPQLLNEDELLGGNALIESGTFVSILLGSLTGSSLVQVGSLGPWIVSAFLLLVAFTGYGFSRSIPKAPASDPGLKVKWNPIPPTFEILKYTTVSRPVFLSILGVSWFWFFGVAVQSMLPIYCRDYLQVPAWGTTIALAVFSVGIGIGSLLCEKLSGKRLELGIVPFGTIGMSLFALDIFLIGRPEGAPGLGVLAWSRVGIDFLLLAMFSGLFIVPLFTMIQERADPSYRSRIVAANNIVNALLMVIAAAMVIGMNVAGFSIPQVFLVLAVLNAAVAIYIYTLLPEFFLRFICWIVANLVYRMKSLGVENVPQQGAAVLICNHVTFVDWLIISSSIKRPVRFVMDHRFAKGAFAKMLFGQAKVIPIAPAKESPEILEKAFQRIQEELSDGNLVCIFPEGMITRDGNMNVFKPGIERIIQQSPVPVIPMALRGLWESAFSRNPGSKSLKNFPWLFRGKVSLEVGELVTADRVSAPDLQLRVAALRGAAL